MRFLSPTAVLSIFASLVVLKRLRGAKALNDKHKPSAKHLRFARLLPAGDYQPTDAEIADRLYAAGQDWRGALANAT